jgi:hypothetical protein
MYEPLLDCSPKDKGGSTNLQKILETSVAEKWCVRYSANDSNQELSLVSRFIPQVIVILLSIPHVFICIPISEKNESLTNSESYIGYCMLR